MSWSLQIPEHTPSTRVVAELRKAHDAKAAAEELSADVDTQMRAAIAAVDVLWHEVTKRDKDGNPTGSLLASINGHAHEGKGSAQNAISINLSAATDD